MSAAIDDYTDVGGRATQDAQAEKSRSTLSSSGGFLVACSVEMTQIVLRMVTRFLNRWAHVGMTN